MHNIIKLKNNNFNFFLYFQKGLKQVRIKKHSIAELYNVRSQTHLLLNRLNANQIIFFGQEDSNRLIAKSISFDHIVHDLEIHVFGAPR